MPLSKRREELSKLLLLNVKECEELQKMKASLEQYMFAVESALQKSKNHKDIESMRKSARGTKANVQNFIKSINDKTRAHFQRVGEILVELNEPNEHAAGSIANILFAMTELVIKHSKC